MLDGGAHDPNPATILLGIVGPLNDAHVAFLWFNSTHHPTVKNMTRIQQRMWAEVAVDTTISSSTKRN
jgi:hypothetical protein